MSSGRGAGEQPEGQAQPSEVEAALRESEERFRLLADATTEGIVVTEGQWVVEVNRAFAEMLGYTPEQMIGMDAADLLAPEFREQLSVRIATLAESRWRPRLLRKDGTMISVESHARTIPYRGRQARVVSIRDLTEQEETEEALRRAEEQYRTLVERIPAIVYLAEFGTPAPWLYISPRVESILGFTSEEWVADPLTWYRQIHPDDRERVLAEEAQSESSGTSLVSEYRLLTREGRVVWVRDEAEVVSNKEGRPAFLRGIMLDITQRKRAEEDRQRLLSRLVAAQEEERARIAEDIHDDPIQAMTAVSMRLETLKRQLETQGMRVQSFDKLLGTVGASITRLRHLMFELRPRALDEDGLAAALSAYLDDMKETTGVRWEVHDRLSEQPHRDTRILLYRIAQEALSNVRKHAGAKNVEVDIAAQDCGFLVRVSDDGIGFERPEIVRSPTGHFGLSSMRERAEMAGGWWRLNSAPGKGTAVEFWLPARPGAPVTD
jgi:PAS domain S-box-containing protein